MQTNVWKFMGLAVFCVVLGDPTLKEVCVVLLVEKDKTMKASITQ